MNEELAERPTSTGMRLRFRWEPLADGPPGLAEARAGCCGSGRYLVGGGPCGRGRVPQERITAERVGDERHLAGAPHRGARLPSWHQFASIAGRTGMAFRGGTASGGERVLTHLPLFAAASAHYRSANPAARG